jgi:hypothetical protein
MKSINHFLFAPLLALSLMGQAVTVHAEGVAAPAASAASAASVVSTSSNEGACILDGTIPVEGKLQPTKDCYQNDGQSPDDFKFLCESMHRMAVEATKAVGTNDGKMTYVAACPAGAYGRCDRFINRPVRAFFYKRSARDLEATRESCYTQGGQWQELPAASKRPVTRRKPK